MSDENLKNIKAIEHDKCCGCFACYNVCPVGAIKMKADAEGFMYPYIIEEKCIKCGKCLRACPVRDKKENKNDLRLAYGAYVNNESTLKHSSSGGLFSALAKQVILGGGVVFGAVFNENFGVHHSYATSEKELADMMGSKYSQSEIGETYKNAEKFLNEGKTVYFSGTPCQIEGLNKYLGNEYENLITQDIVCHGVPSPRVWQHYLKNHLQLQNINYVNFRSKEKGWNNYKLKIIADGEKIIPKENIYMKGYVANLFLRGSCHKCEFKSKNKNSDITLADYWGCQSADEEIYNFYGTSLVVIHSEKGKLLFDSIKNDITYKETDFEKAVDNNKSYYIASNPHKYRKKFFDILEKTDFEKIIKKRTAPSFTQKCKNKIKSVIKDK